MFKMMVSLSVRRTLFTAICSVAAGLAPASAQYLNGQSATSVLGQPNFNSTFAGSPTATSQGGPRGVAIDRDSGAVFVADGSNNRILRYGSLAALQTGAAAEAVLGQDNFTTLTAATTRDGLSTPHGLWVDGNGRLWVADTNNNRVLWFNNASTAANGADATGVLGQGTAAGRFTTSNTGNSSTGLNKPRAVIVDQDGILWVADSGNNRVLRYIVAAIITDGAAAQRVLGQTNFGFGAAGSGAGGMSDPAGLAFDRDGTLWVADAENNRVLGFADAVSLNNGAAATRVLGQTSFAGTSSGDGAAGLFRPEGVYFDGQLNTDGSSLYVADRANNRVVIHFNPGAKADGAAADRILGGFSGAGANRFSNPVAIARTADFQLLVADRGNNRTLRFPPVSVPSLRGAPATVRVKVKRRATATFTLTNTNFPGAYRITTPRTGRNFAVAATFPNGGTTAVLPVGGTQTVKLTIRGRKATRRPVTIAVAATAVAVPNRSATATARVIVRK